MTSLPAPRGWRFGTLRAVGRSLGGLAGAVLVVAALGGLAVTRRGESLVGVGIGVFVLARAARFGPVGRGAVPRLVTAGGETGVELPFSRLRVAGEVAEDLALAVGGAGVALASGAEDPTWNVVLGLVAVAFGLGRALRTWHGGGKADPGLVLTPDGVTYAAGYTQWYVPWDRVTEVRASSSVFERYVPHEWFVTLETGSGGVELTDERHDVVQHVDSVEIAVDPLAVHPRVAFWMLRHYAGHPADRAELADARAIGRLGRGELR